MKFPTFIIVDLREVIKRFIEYRSFYDLYQRFPLQDIIQTVLSTATIAGPSEFIWHEIETRFGEDLEKIDTNILELFFEHVMLSVDEHIGQRVPSKIDTCEYIFEKWVTPDTMVLRIAVHH